PLVMTGLQDEPSAPFQMASRPGSDPAVKVKAVLVAVQGDVGVVEPHFLLQFLYDVPPDIGRVGHDHIAGSFHLLKKIASEKPDVGSQLPAVHACRRHGCLRYIRTFKPALPRHFSLLSSY